MAASITIADIKLFNGCAVNYSDERTVMSETGLPAETEVIFYKTRCRKKGPDYTNDMYHIKGTNNLLIIRHLFGQKCWDSVMVVQGYFTRRKEYAEKVGKLTKKFKIPFRVGLALGYNEEIYSRFIAAIEDFENISEEKIKLLKNGEIESKEIFREVIGKDLYNDLRIDVMGITHYKRLRKYVAWRLENKKQAE